MQKTFRLEYLNVLGKVEKYYTSALNKSYAYNYAIDHMHKSPELQELIAVVAVHSPTMDYDWLH